MKKIEYLDIVLSILDYVKNSNITYETNDILDIIYDLVDGISEELNNNEAK